MQPGELIDYRHSRAVAAPTAELEGFGTQRHLAGWGRTAMLAGALGFSTFQLLVAAFSPLSSQITRSLHVGFLLLLAYLIYPARKRNANLMVGFAKAMTDEEITVAAEYFGGIAWAPLWVKVKETNRVPKTHIDNGLFVPSEGAETEPIGKRIVEVPENEDLSENLRDPRSGFIAYVPPGSLKKGESLVTTGGARTVRCAVCHGPDLKGLGPVPGIAGRSPSYLIRQIYDMQVDARKGEWTQLMKPVVAKLNEDDLIAIGAYVASIQ